MTDEVSEALVAKTGQDPRIRTGPEKTPSTIYKERPDQDPRAFEVSVLREKKKDRGEEKNGFPANPFNSF